MVLLLYGVVLMGLVDVLVFDCGLRSSNLIRFRQTSALCPAMLQYVHRVMLLRSPLVYILVRHFASSCP